MLETNKIYLGDCYELIKQIPNNSIDLIYTDVPYSFLDKGVSKEADLKRLKMRLDKYRAIMDANPVGSSEYVKAHIKHSAVNQAINCYDISSGFDFSILDQFVRVMKEINIFIWCSKSQIPYLLNYFINKNCNFEILVWCKTNCVPATNNTFLPNVEYCLFFRQKGSKRKLNNGYDLKSKYYLSSANQSDKAKYTHPTIKPLELVKKHILHTTNENDIVLDAFLGSGTTAKACRETNRRYIGFEINEEYYKIAADRLNNINARGEVSIF